MKLRYLLALLTAAAILGRSSAEDIVTLDGLKYENVENVKLETGGLYFVTGAGDSLRGVTVPYAKLPTGLKDKYHYDPFEMGLALARENRTVNLTKNLAFSLDNLDAAKKKARTEKKLLGFIMEWDSMLVPSQPLYQGSGSGLAHFYDVFNDGMVLVFVRHEAELSLVPDAVKTGFQGPDEGGFAPNMAVVTADCKTFICEIPYGGNESNGAIREKIFRQKIAVIKQFLQTQTGKP